MACSVISRVFDWIGTRPSMLSQAVALLRFTVDDKHRGDPRYMAAQAKSTDVFSGYGRARRSSISLSLIN